MEAYRKLIRAADALRMRYKKATKIEGLTTSQFSTMMQIRENTKMSQREIAEHLIASGGNVTVLVDKLESQGLVKRERSTEDRRMVFVTLTPQGEQALDRLASQYNDGISEAMSGISKEETATLIDLLERIMPPKEEKVQKRRGRKKLPKLRNLD